jgi:hypothetical protein
LYLKLRSKQGLRILTRKKSREEEEGEAEDKEREGIEKRIQGRKTQPRETSLGPEELVKAQPGSWQGRNMPASAQGNWEIEY